MSSEIQVRLDYIVKTFQEAMKKIDSVSSVLSGFSEEISSFKKTISENSVKIDEILSHQDEKNTEFTAINSVSRKNTDDLASKLAKSSIRIDDMSKDLNSITILSEANAAKLAGLDNTIIRVDLLFSSVEDLKKNLSMAMDKVFANQSNLSAQIEANSKGLSELAKELKYTKNEFKTTEALSLRNSEGVSRLDTKNNEIVAELKYLISNSESRSLNHLVETVGKISIPSVKGLATQEELKKSSASFDKAILDSSNANLRSTNNEYKITILEKKIEQLQLLLNKYQLTGV